MVPLTEIEKRMGNPDYHTVFQSVLESKQLLRTGWVMAGVPNPESVAEHSFGVGMLAMVLSEKIDPTLDRDKLIKMSLLHDLGEIITGDVVVQRGEIIDLAKRDGKEKAEREGIKKIFAPMGQADEYLAIFDEMTGRVTRESQIFWQFDKLEMAMQAFAYEQSTGIHLNEFFISAELSIKEPLLKTIFKNIVRKRRFKK